MARVETWLVVRKDDEEVVRHAIKRSEFQVIKDTMAKYAMKPNVELRLEASDTRAYRVLNEVDFRTLGLKASDPIGYVDQLILYMSCARSQHDADRASAEARDSGAYADPPAATMHRIYGAVQRPTRFGLGSISGRICG